MKKKKHFNKAELITSVTGLILFLFVFTYMLITSLLSNESPPDIIVKSGAIKKNSGNYLVEITVYNNGYTTAEGLEVEGSLISGSKMIENSRTVFDYLPRQSFRKGGLIFKNNPDSSELIIRALGFEEP